MRPPIAIHDSPLLKSRGRQDMVSGPLNEPRSQRPATRSYTCTAAIRSWIAIPVK